MAEVIVKSKKYGDKIVLIDDSDLSFFNSRNWFVQYSHKNSTFYIICNKLKGDIGSKIFHRRLLGVMDAKVFVDHINGNGLDNRRSNLRLCTAMQNAHNAKKRVDGKTSKYKGVYFVKDCPINPYAAKIGYKGKPHYLGTFKTAEEAARAYNEAARKYHGEFAVLNEISEL